MTSTGSTRQHGLGSPITGQQLKKFGFATFFSATPISVSDDSEKPPEKTAEGQTLLQMYEALGTG